MRKVFVILACVGCSIQALMAQQSADLQKMYDFLQTSHFTPRAMDSLMTEGTAQRFFQQFDYGGYYLDATTRDALQAKAGMIATDAARGTDAFEQLLYATVAEADDRVIAMLKSDAFWDFGYDSTRRFSYKGRVAKNHEELTENWRRYVQFETLMEYFHRADAPSFTGYLNSYAQLKARVRSMWDCRMKKSTSQEVRKAYFQAFLSGYDPYTEYFDEEEVKSFMYSLSSDLHGLGFFLKQDLKGDYIITEVIEGSTAEKMGVKKDDQLLAISRDNEPLDLDCYRDMEINEMLFGEDTAAVNVVIRSENRTDSLRLKKELLNTEVKAVQPYVLIGERRIGYISIPSFYFGDAFGVGSMSRDLAMALWQLSREGVDGVMLGLQGNGGGSIDEAVEFLSLFLDEGDLFQIKENNGKPKKVKDPVRGMMYYGPLMILVDGQSASASELVAMVLQEQTRALIVGDTTYGKTSAQTIVPLGDLNNPNPTQLIKFTTSGWYNLRGRSFHETGLTPDVHVPLMSYRDERGQPYDPVKSVLGARQKYMAVPRAVLQAKSDERMKWPVFKEKQEAMAVFRKMLKSTEGLALTFDQMQKFEQLFRVLDAQLKPLDFEIRPMNPSGEDELYLDWIKRDILVAEGFNVFLDWLDANGK